MSYCWNHKQVLLGTYGENKSGVIDKLAQLSINKDYSKNTIVCKPLQEWIYFIFGNIKMYIHLLFLLSFYVLYLSYSFFVKLHQYVNDLYPSVQQIIRCFKSCTCLCTWTWSEWLGSDYICSWWCSAISKDRVEFKIRYLLFWCVFSQ